ncbi:MAG: acetate--CoA ligase [Flavobacteriales bacterium]|nr:acetate--CoA ligase [Flavobacteriales bacterium]
MSEMNDIRNFSEYQKAYHLSLENPEKFWNDIALDFYWKKKWEKTLQWNFTQPDIKWFCGGKLNITENCLDRHLDVLGNHPAIVWEPNHPEEHTRILTYNELYLQVCRFSNVLKNLGVYKGDRVCIYMPMVPEVVIAMLACARIGAVHSVVFGGFSATALRERIIDAQSTVIITTDGAYRGAKQISMKQTVDESLEHVNIEQKVIVLRHTGQPVSMISGRDVWWHEAMQSASDECEAEEMDAEDMLFILYTSGSTGKPKGVVHTIGGYMVYTGYTFKQVFQYQPGEVFWCTADVGWITGHSYVVYGPLLNGATVLMFEGVPNWPDPSRLWQVIDKYKVNIFYTAPTAIRALMAEGDDWLKPYSLQSLRVIGSVGEPINHEAWEWFYHQVGKGKCPLVDTWWQTETGGIMIAPLAGITPLKPTYASLPLPGIQPVLLDNEGNEILENEKEGLLCIKFPWPSMIRTTYGDHERCRQNYFAAFSGYYFTGDGARRDKDGFYRIIGRVDDVINVSGHRIGTAEVEDAINEHENVVESAVVGYPHSIKGQGIIAFVICNQVPVNEEETRKEIGEVVSRIIGPIARPDKIIFVPGLPKTRSGKIMRRILRKIAEGDVSNLGDTSTLLDPFVVEKIMQAMKG